MYGSSSLSFIIALKMLHKHDNKAVNADLLFPIWFNTPIGAIIFWCLNFLPNLINIRKLDKIINCMYYSHNYLNSVMRGTYCIIEDFLMGIKALLNIEGTSIIICQLCNDNHIFNIHYVHWIWNKFFVS